MPGYRFRHVRGENTHIAARLRSLLTLPNHLHPPLLSLASVYSLTSSFYPSFLSLPSLPTHSHICPCDCHSLPGIPRSLSLNVSLSISDTLLSALLCNLQQSGTLEIVAHQHVNGFYTGASSSYSFSCIGITSASAKRNPVQQLKMTI